MIISRKERPFLTGSSDFALLSPILVPRPPLSLMRAVFSRNVAGLLEKAGSSFENGIWLIGAMSASMM